MSTATVTSKGQITIPVDVRRALDLEEGDRVEFVEVEPGRFELVAATHSIKGSHREEGSVGTMIGLDTNVVVRYIMQDDPKQSPKAVRLIEALTADEPGFISLVSIVELVWITPSIPKRRTMSRGGA
jgi:AbrB family looped-hinge helix DNA binding protein